MHGLQFISIALVGPATLSMFLEALIYGQPTAATAIFALGWSLTCATVALISYALRKH